MNQQGKRPTLKNKNYSFARMTEKEKNIVERSQGYFEKFDYDFYVDSFEAQENPISHLKIPSAIHGNMLQLLAMSRG